jgi:AhpD family alkylhydroperoxidase
MSTKFTLISNEWQMIAHSCYDMAINGRGGHKMNEVWDFNKSRIGQGFENFKAASNEKSLLDDKTKELIRMVVSSVLRCQHCTDSHLKKALAAGATRDEITEALLIMAQQSASNQISWNLESFEKYLGEK